MLHPGMMCKTPLCNIFRSLHPNGVKVFVPRTSSQRWSSPKTIYATSVFRADWSPKQPQFWCRCGTLVHGQVSYQVRGTWLSSCSSSCFSSHALRPRFKSQIHHDSLVSDCLDLGELSLGLNQLWKKRPSSNPGCAQAQHRAPSSGWTQRIKIPWRIHSFHPHFLIENHMCAFGGSNISQTEHFSSQYNYKAAKSLLQPFTSAKFWEMEDYRGDTQEVKNYSGASTPSDAL